MAELTSGLTVALAFACVKKELLKIAIFLLKTYSTRNKTIIINFCYEFFLVNGIATAKLMLKHRPGSFDEVLARNSVLGWCGQ